MKWTVERQQLPGDPSDPRGRRIRLESAPPEEVEAVRMEITPGGALVFTDEEGNPVRAYGPTGWAKVYEYVEPSVNPNLPGGPPGAGGPPA
jgi:hypothetical protein